MEEQKKGNNEEEWWECAWVKIIILIVICGMPIIINRVTMFENSSHDYDTPSPWTEVWAVYGGALVSAGIALLILHKQQKENEKQNDFNRKLQINALKYQQQYDWLYKLKNALSDLKIACDKNIIRRIIRDVYHYYNLTDKNEIYKAKNEINESVNNCFCKITSSHSSFLSMLDKKAKKVLDDKLKCLDKDICYYYNILNNLEVLIVFIKNPVFEKKSKEKIKSWLEYVLEKDEKELELLDEKERLVHEIILKEHFEKFYYDFYGYSLEILNSIYDDFKNKVKSMDGLITDILQLERDQIDNLLDVEEIKKNLNAN